MSSERNEKIKGYWEGEAQVYDDGIKKELEGPFREAWTRLILENAPEGDHLEILDVGTGPGFFPVALGQKGHHVTGIDITENMIAKARENATRYGVEADLRTMDSQHLDLPDERFDMVICRNVTWTLDDPQQAYREWKRVLRKGGTLLVFDACWYLWRYDEEMGRVYRENEAKIREKYNRGIHAHNDPAEGEDLAGRLFMSDKVRPAWDLAYLLEIGFDKVFAQRDITDLVWDDLTKELNWVTPQFMVGAVK